MMLYRLPPTQCRTVIPGKRSRKGDTVHSNGAVISPPWVKIIISLAFIFATMGLVQSHRYIICGDCYVNDWPFCFPKFTSGTNLPDRITLSHLFYALKSLFLLIFALYWKIRENANEASLMVQTTGSGYEPRRMPLTLFVGTLGFQPSGTMSSLFRW